MFISLLASALLMSPILAVDPVPAKPGTPLGSRRSLQPRNVSIPMSFEGSLVAQPLGAKSNGLYGAFAGLVSRQTLCDNPTFVPCGDGLGCRPPDGVCCPSNSFCTAGHTCYTSPSGKEGCCPVGRLCTGEPSTECPENYVRCSNGFDSCVTPRAKCCSADIICAEENECSKHPSGSLGCCPKGKACYGEDDNWCEIDGDIPCEGVNTCAPPNTQCCRNGKYCENGQTCTSTGCCPAGDTSCGSGNFNVPFMKGPNEFFPVPSGSAPPPNTDRVQPSSAVFSAPKPSVAQPSAEEPSAVINPGVDKPTRVVAVEDSRTRGTIALSSSTSSLDNASTPSANNPSTPSANDPSTATPADNRVGSGPTIQSLSVPDIGATNVPNVPTTRAGAAVPAAGLANAALAAVIAIVAF